MIHTAENRTDKRADFTNAARGPWTGRHRKSQKRSAFLIAQTSGLLDAARSLRVFFF
jgi:hypothetical protein